MFIVSMQKYIRGIFTNWDKHAVPKAVDGFGCECPHVAIQLGQVKIEGWYSVMHEIKSSKSVHDQLKQVERLSPWLVDGMPIQPTA